MDTDWILEAAPRTALGKNAVRKLRRQGYVPGVIYGTKASESVQVPVREASRMVDRLHGYSRMITLRMKDGRRTVERPVLFKDVQLTPVKRFVLHIDFNEVDVKQAIQVPVEVLPVGEPEGVVQGGLMQTVNHEITVECLPTKLPEVIEVDVSALNIGDTIHIGEIALPDGVTAVGDPEEPVFTVTGLRPEAEVEAEAAEAEEEAAAEAEGGEEAGAGEQEE